MSKIVKFYIALMGLLFMGIIIIELTKEQPINWTPTYNENHKIPYGSYVFYNELEHIFPQHPIRTINVSPYQYFNDFQEVDRSQINKGTYIKINQNLDLDPISINELLNFTAIGNDLFLSTNRFPRILKDTLNFETENIFNLSGKATFSLANPRFKKDSVTIEKRTNSIYFSRLDPQTSTVLGYQNNSNKSFINYVKIKYKKGNIYLHLQPIIFTNYNLLKTERNLYSAGVLSYIKNQLIFYDSANKIEKKLGMSPLRFILSQAALKYAWYLLLITFLLFIIFNAKRKQRLIKIIIPNENTTLAFIKTISNLYYETKDHNNLIEKKITYFLEHLRRVYFIDTQLLNDNFVKILALKSGNDIQITKNLVDYVVLLRAKQDCNENDLITLNKAIERFYNS